MEKTAISLLILTFYFLIPNNLSHAKIRLKTSNYRIKRFVPRKQYNLKPRFNINRKAPRIIKRNLAVSSFNHKPAYQKRRYIKPLKYSPAYSPQVRMNNGRHLLLRKTPRYTPRRRSNFDHLASRYDEKISKLKEKIQTLSSNNATLSQENNKLNQQVKTSSSTISSLRASVSNASYYAPPPPPRYDPPPAEVKKEDPSVNNEEKIAEKRDINEPINPPKEEEAKPQENPPADQPKVEEEAKVEEKVEENLAPPPPPPSAPLPPPPPVFGKAQSNVIKPKSKPKASRLGFNIMNALKQKDTEDTGDAIKKAQAAVVSQIAGIARISSSKCLKAPVSKIPQGIAHNSLQELMKAYENPEIRISHEIGQVFYGKIKSCLYNTYDEEIIKQFSENILNKAKAQGDKRIQIIDQIISVNPTLPLKIKCIKKFNIVTLINLCRSNHFRSKMINYVKDKYINIWPNKYSDKDIKLISVVLEDLFEISDPSIKDWFEDLIPKVSYTQLLLLSELSPKFKNELNNKLINIIADNIKYNTFQNIEALNIIIDDFVREYKSNRFDLASKKSIELWLTNLALEYLKKEEKQIFFVRDANVVIANILAEKFIKDPKNEEAKKACITYIETYPNDITRISEVLSRFEIEDLSLLNNKAYIDEINNRERLENNKKLDESIKNLKEVGLFINGSFDIEKANKVWSKIAINKKPNPDYLKVFLRELSNIEDPYLNKYPKFMLLKQLATKDIIKKFPENVETIYDLYNELYNADFKEPNSGGLLGDQLLKKLDSKGLEKLSILNIKSSHIVHLSKLLKGEFTKSDLYHMMSNLLQSRTRFI